MPRKPRTHYTETDKSLTWDRGKEMADHKRFTLDTDIKVYFCDPQSSRATRLQREHERLAQAVLPEGNGSIERSPEQAERGCQTT
jgi:IS30 family transposase